MVSFQHHHQPVWPHRETRPCAKRRPHPHPHRPHTGVTYETLLTLDLPRCCLPGCDLRPTHRRLSLRRWGVLGCQSCLFQDPLRHRSLLRPGGLFFLFGCLFLENFIVHSFLKYTIVIYIINISLIFILYIYVIFFIIFFL